MDKTYTILDIEINYYDFLDNTLERTLTEVWLVYVGTEVDHQ